MLRQRTKDQQDQSRLSARVAHLQELVAWADELPVPYDLETNTATPSAWQRFQDMLALAHKILADRQEGAERKTLSVHDPEARRGKHGEYYDGYLVDMLMDADSGIITQMNVIEAGGDEARDALELVRAEQAAHGNQIEALSIDGAGFNGLMLRELEGAVTVEEPPQDEALQVESPQAKVGLGVKVYVPPKSQRASEQFPAADFTLNEERTTVTCPAGQTSQYSQRDNRRFGTIFRFTRATCDSCPLVRQCMARPGTGAFGRSVTKNDYDAEYRRARERAKTPEYEAVRKEHPAVERKLNEVLNHHGGREARYWGRGKVRIQQLMTGFVVNTKRMVSRMAALRAEPRGTCPNEA